MKRLLQIVSVTAVLLIGLFLLVVFSNTTAQPVEVKKTVYTPAQLLVEANKLRAEKGVAPLVLDERLNQSAQWKADDMEKYNYYEHVRDGYSGHLKAGEYVPECVYAGENMDGTQSGESPFDKITGWPASKTHYEAEIDPKYDITGFGVVKNGPYYTYVQHFCDLK